MAGGITRLRNLIAHGGISDQKATNPLLLCSSVPAVQKKN